MPYDGDQLFVWTPELSIGLRAGAFNGYGKKNDLDETRKRAALETWMTSVTHEATGDHLINRGNVLGYLEWLEADLGEIGIQNSKALYYWNQLRLVVNHNNDRNNPYNDDGVKENLEAFNKWWCSEHSQLDNSLLRKPFKEGNKEWRVVHANQQHGLVALFKQGILTGKQTIHHGHAYTNEQGRGGMLPSRSGGYWAHDYQTGKSGRGAARVVLGPTGKNDNTREAWFTDNHYATFVRVYGGHPLVGSPH